MGAAHECAKGTTAKDMQVQMRHGLPAMLARVDNHPIAARRDPFPRCDTCRDDEQMPEQCLVCRVACGEARDRLDRHDEQMYRRGRRDVAEGDAAVIAIDDITGNFTRDDAAKDRWGGTGSVTPSPRA